MEQNTDRMYWTVGIIVLGAVVIAVAAKLFPELATEVVGKVTGILNGAPDIIPAPKVG